MQATQWEREPGVIGQLFAEPWRFSFTAAVTLLLRWLIRQGVPHEEALTKVLCFQNSLSLAFPAAEVEALRIDDFDAGHRVVLTPTCFGLLGTGGVLPLHDTDRCAHVATRSDAGSRAYLDSCSTRIVTLFWQAWAKPRLELAPEAEGRDASHELLRGLAGRQDCRKDASAWHAGLLRMRPVSGDGIERIVAGGLGLPVVVETLAGFWDGILPGQRNTLGGPNPVLGHSFVLGTRLWRIDRRLRLVIGPLNRNDFDRMLPGEPGAKQLRELLMLATPQCMLDFEICLLPAEGCIAPLVLADESSVMRRLGYDTVLAGPAPAQRKVRYLLDLSPEGNPPCH
ncbi:type VI secretion system protein ImpH [Pseudoduganella flava]|uniref:Type VI secretion system baseplate subunit TssG n=1 Tax=Pseudoduganella flava TaxID=871742 RepID=A0A562PLF2_9BURK|nr:type VI secretion system baseplate subunit TssG [Pseudoduganella flava]QGZ41011.1 type VI secretion system baseplate subunit TssG [Pseudoduganella flava]TWI45301.1 type VI secretion system protein ImpH [Pseudoduganella flava]